MSARSTVSVVASDVVSVVASVVSVVVSVIDALLVTLKSLTTFLLLIAFGVGARVVNGLASLFLKAALASRSSAVPNSNRTEQRRNLAVPHDQASTLNYLYTPPTKGTSLRNAEYTPRTDSFDHFAATTSPPPSLTSLHDLPARMSLTESIKVWIWLTVDIAFDIPRYLLGTASHPLPGFRPHESAHLQSIVQMERHVTTSSVIREAGYPLEEHTVTTSDGYELTMQRLPRKDATKVVFFMHGVLDTSLGWVCNGPIGSHAFTAHDSGADVWLGNCRANEGVGDRRRGVALSNYLEYWAYSINELGLNDVEGMLRYIADVLDVSGEGADKELHIVAHSLGAASVLIHLVFSASELPIKQIILLAPAGFHSRAPFLALPFTYTVPPLMWLANGLLGIFGARAGLPAYIPSRLLRAVAFKLATDFHSVPALNELSLSLLRLLVNGDSSDWDRALQMPHYAAESMPAISVHTGAHLIQLIRRQKFELYDYGWKKLNRSHYGEDAPPDVAERYGALAQRHIRVHLVAGAYDGVISKVDIKRHFESMRRCGVNVTYTELELGHLDVCFGGHEDVVRLVDELLSSS